MSDALWSLSRPASVRSQDDTQYLFPWVKALDDSRWLVVDTDFEINVHPLADAAAIITVLQPYEDSGALPAGTLAALTLRVEELRGSRMVVYDEFPALFKLEDTGNPTGLGRTEQMMIDAGLLNKPEFPKD